MNKNKRLKGARVTSINSKTSADRASPNEIVFANEGLRYQITMYLSSTVAG